MRVLWIARSNKPILKETSPEYSLEGLRLKLKLKLQYFGHLIQGVDSLENLNRKSIFRKPVKVALLSNA